MANLAKPLLRYRLSSNSVSSLARKRIIERDNAHKLIYSKKLSQIGLIPTEEELDIHRKICTGKPNINIEFLEKVENWLNKIKNKNSVFDKNELNKLLNKYWFKICKKYTSFGYENSFKRYKNSGLSKLFDTSLKDLSKFFIRALLKRNIK